MVTENTGLPVAYECWVGEVDDMDYKVVQKVQSLDGSMVIWSMSASEALKGSALLLRAALVAWWHEPAMRRKRS